MCGEKMNKSNDQRNIVIAGVDILPGYSPSSSNKQPHYAMVFLRNGEVIDSYEDVSFARMIRLLWEYKPDILAIDNVFELKETVSGLSKLLTLFPPNTRIVQVTGWGPEAVNIKTVARNLGIEVHGKLSPLKTAYLAAMIAWKGGGATLRLLEEKTKIIVTKGRSVSHGGMSYNRFMRSIRASILATTKEIKRILDKNKLDYDVTFKKSMGGLERSVFVVYAPREKLYGLIKPIKNKSVRVIIKPIYREKIVLETPHKKPGKSRGIIIGLDPGIYTGVAVIDLDGTPLLTFSSKNLDRADILGMVSGLGRVVMVATDVSKPPANVKKLAATLNVQLYVPDRDLSTEEKQEIVRDIKARYPWIEIDDTHERDALAAAYKAYLTIRDKMIQAEAKASEMTFPINIDRVKIMVAMGASIAEAIEHEIEKAVAMVKEEVETPRKKPKRTPSFSEKELMDKIDDLSRKIKVLEAEKRRLLDQLEQYKRRVEELELELKTLKLSRSDNDELARRIYMLEQENRDLSQRLKKALEELHRTKEEKKNLVEVVKKIVRGNYVSVLSTEIFSPSLISLVRNRDYPPVIHVRNPGTLLAEHILLLKQERIGLLVEEPMGIDDIPVLDLNNYDHVFLEDELFVESRVIGDLENAWEEIRRREEEEKFVKIVRLIEEYKKERMKRLGLKKEPSLWEFDKY